MRFPCVHFPFLKKKTERHKKISEFVSESGNEKREFKKRKIGLTIMYVIHFAQLCPAICILFDRQLS